MSCKVLSGGEQKNAQPLQWRRIGATQPDSASMQRSDSATADPGSGGDVDAHKLRTRIAELERALEAEVRQAHGRGFQEGVSAGRDAASAEIKPVMERLLQSCSDLAGLRARIRKDTEAEMVTLTVAISRRVLRRELSIDPEAIHGVVNAALSKMQAKEITVIRTSPEHAGAVRSYFEKAGLNTGIQLVADASLPSGGLVLETKRGNLDASVDTQLKEIERGFADRLGR